MKWSVFLVIGWVVLAAVPQAQKAVPTSHWFEVAGIEIEDTVVGVCPVMIVDRSINRAFRADWRVTILRKGGHGYVTYRTYSGGNDYRPGNELPDMLDLAWWTWRDQLENPCPWPPGEYRVNTLWDITTPGGQRRQVRAQSNRFEIRGSEHDH